MLPDPCVAFPLNHLPATFEDRPSYSAAVLQSFIGGVDDGIHAFRGDVTLDELDGLACWQNAIFENDVHVIILPR